MNYLNNPVACRSLLGITAVLAVFVIFVSGCGSSAPHRIHDEDLTPQAEKKVFENLLVVGAYEDRTYHVSSETAFAEELKTLGVMASPSYDILPDLKAMESDEAVAERLASIDQDGILVVATLDEGYDYDLGDYYETRGMVYLLGGQPGAGTDMGAFLAWAGSGQYTLYVGLWDAKTLKPVWQSTTDSSTTGSETDDSKALADLVVAHLREKGLIRPQTQG